MIIPFRSDGYSRYSHANSKRSKFRSFTRVGDLRRRTTSCWRRMRFSASSRARRMNCDRIASSSWVRNATRPLQYHTPTRASSRIRFSGGTTYGIVGLSCVWRIVDLCRKISNSPHTGRQPAELTVQETAQTQRFTPGLASSEKNGGHRVRRPPEATETVAKVIEQHSSTAHRIQRCGSSPSASSLCRFQKREQRLVHWPRLLRLHPVSGAFDDHLATQVRHSFFHLRDHRSAAER